MKYIASLITTLILTLSVPTTSNAYFTTGQTAFTANNAVGVYVIDFAFGHEKYDVHIPVSARWGADASDTVLAFDVVNEAGLRGTGSAIGIVLSDADIEEGMYVIPKGFSKTMRLLVLYTKSTSETGAFRMNVTHLPFSFDGRQKLKLNRSELEYYSTASVDLGALAPAPAPQVIIPQK